MLPEYHQPWVAAAAEVARGPHQYERTGWNLGSGTYGDVEQARDRRTGDQVAVKRLGQAASNAVVTVIRETSVMREVGTLLQCGGDVGKDAQHLMPLRDAFPKRDRMLPTIVMDMCHTNLDEFSKLFPHRRVPECCIRTLTRDTLRGLRCLHDAARVAHRDVKPANVLLCVAPVANYRPTGHPDDEASTVYDSSGPGTPTSADEFVAPGDTSSPGPAPRSDGTDSGAEPDNHSGLLGLALGRDPTPAPDTPRHYCPFCASCVEAPVTPPRSVMGDPSDDPQQRKHQWARDLVAAWAATGDAPQHRLVARLSDFGAARFVQRQPAPPRHEAAPGTRLPRGVIPPSQRPACPSERPATRLHAAALPLHPSAAAVAAVATPAPPAGARHMDPQARPSTPPGQRPAVLPLEYNAASTGQGTLAYRPPEDILAAVSGDGLGASTALGVGNDLWAVGCVLAELYLGHTLFCDPFNTAVGQLMLILAHTGSPNVACDCLCSQPGPRPASAAPCRGNCWPGVGHLPGYLGAQTAVVEVPPGDPRHPSYGQAPSPFVGPAIVQVRPTASGLPRFPPRPADAIVCRVDGRPTTTLGALAPPAALDLLERLLTLDPARRISADDALRHPFLAL